MNTQPLSRDGQPADTLKSDDVLELQECLNLVREAETQGLAVEKYTMLRDRLLIESPVTVDLLDMMWEALLVSRRSASVWERLCYTEKRLTDRMTESHIQLHQNYLRLVQEL